MMLEKLFNWHVPQALTSSEWRTWHDTQRRERPIAYWFCETIPNWCAPFKSRVTDLPYTLRMKYVTRYDIIRTGLPRSYHDGDTRMLHGMFSILVDFVEIEKAHMQYVFSENTDPRPWYARRPFRFLSYRDAQAGLEYLAWEMSLDDGSEFGQDNVTQSHAAREIHSLYMWWKHQRPQRLDPYDASGWTDYCKQHYENTERDFLDEHADDQTGPLLKRLHEIEDSYSQEDQDNLIRLVKVRNHLWT